LCCAAIAVVLDRKCRRNARKSREWTKNWLSKRQHFSHANLLKELRFHPMGWHNFLRMSESTYLTLLSMVSPLIEGKKTLYTANYNSSRQTYSHFKIFGGREKLEDLKFSTIMSSQALGKIIPETYHAIYKMLKEYFKVRVKI
jgi:hypothetical protein